MEKSSCGPGGPGTRGVGVVVVVVVGNKGRGNTQGAGGQAGLRWVHERWLVICHSHCVSAK
eukprot:10384757-Prorocentrum_lima.AAC.1